MVSWYPRETSLVQNYARIYWPVNAAFCSNFLSAPVGRYPPGMSRHHQPLRPPPQRPVERFPRSRPNLPLQAPQCQFRWTSVPRTPPRYAGPVFHPVPGSVPASRLPAASRVKPKPRWWDSSAGRPRRFRLAQPLAAAAHRAVPDCYFQQCGFKVQSEVFSKHESGTEREKTNGTRSGP